MKSIWFTLLLIFTSAFVSAQVPADMKKFQDSLERAVKAFQEGLREKVKTLEKTGQPQQPGKSSPATAPASATETERPALPPRNHKLLAKIPAKTLTRAELLIYINGLQQNLQKQKGNAKAIAAAKNKMGGYPASSHEVLAFLFFAKKEYVSSLWVFCSVVKANPANLNALANLAAVLNHVGFPHKSIPLSLHTLAAAPSAAAVHNNLGQAYFRLGDMDNAIRYLSSATRLAPLHVEANATQGYINEARGNTGTAAQQYRNSLQGGYNKVAADGMKRAAPESDISKLIRIPARENYPEKDDNIPFGCPVYPGGGYAAAVLFNARQTAEAEAWRITAVEYEEKAGQALGVSAMNIFRSQQNSLGLAFRVSPFFDKAQLIIGRSYQHYMEDSRRFQDEFDKWKENFTKTWSRRIDEACAELKSDECCAVLIRLYDQRNEAYMAAYNQYCEKMWKAARWHYNTVAYWYPVVKSVPLAAKDLIGARAILLQTASRLSQVQLDPYTCATAAEREMNAEKNAEFTDPECPFDINIPLGVGDISLGCESFSIDLGEGIIGGLEYEFESGQTTVYMGVGVQAELGVLSVEASATQYLCFDSQFNITDVGNVVSAEASVMDISSTLGISGASAEANVTFSVNDGLSMGFQESVMGQSILAGEIQLL